MKVAGPTEKGRFVGDLDVQVMFDEDHSSPPRESQLLAPIPLLSITLQPRVNRFVGAGCSKSFAPAPRPRTSPPAEKCRHAAMAQHGDPARVNSWRRGGRGGKFPDALEIRLVSESRWTGGVTGRRA